MGWGGGGVERERELGLTGNRWGPPSCPLPVQEKVGGPRGNSSRKEGRGSWRTPLGSTPLHSTS